MLLAVVGMLVEIRLVVEDIKLLEHEAELATEETALYLGDIDLNFRGEILLPRNDKREFIRSILKLSTDKPQFTKTICSGKLFENRIVQKPNHIFPL